MIDEGTAEDVPVTEILANSTLHIAATVDRGLDEVGRTQGCKPLLSEDRRSRRTPRCTG
jgi:hypothetical protein